MARERFDPRRMIAAVVAALALAPCTFGHTPEPHDVQHAHAEAGTIWTLASSHVASIESAAIGAAMATDPWQAESFKLFAPSVRTRADEQWLFVESDGLPHPPLEFTMMVGITAWQQQVPLPQNYSGANAWQIPLKPKLADKPVTGKLYLRRGAIALAANGIPIFNALNNRGEDAFAIGELDAFGGHCGRGDDYHYHAAPLALQKIVGKDRPIAFALDGFPIFGLFDPKARPGSDAACPLGAADALDEWNGHFCTVPKGQGIDGGTRSYHYHASKTYPYINGGMRGEVKVENDEIVPQAHAQPVREALTALRGARITGFERRGEKSWAVLYELGGRRGSVAYEAADAGTWKFTFTKPDGSVTSETYSPRARGGGGGGRQGGARGGQGGNRAPREGAQDRPPPPPGEGDDRPPPPGEGRRGDRQARSEPEARKPSDFDFRCTGLTSGGSLEAKYTCDGDGISPPFEWSGLPAGTKSLALTMHHIAPGNDEHVYIVNWDIPATTKSIAAGKRIGAWGANTVSRRAEYAPPCSQGPGTKIYIATLYALRETPKLAGDGTTTRADLLAAIKDITLGSAAIDLKYARAEGGAQDAPPADGDRPRGGRGGRKGGGGNANRGEGDGAQDTQARGNEGGGRAGEGGARGGEGGGKAQGGLLAQMTAFHTEVPAHDLDVILARPTDTSITVSVRTAKPSEVMVEFGKVGGGSMSKSPAVRTEAGKTALIELTGLQAGSAYRYRVLTKGPGDANAEPGEEHRFRTRPASGTPFTFTIQADSHLDANMNPKVYERTLANALTDRPDFHVDLGDTFMTDKRGREFERTAPQYDAQRWYFGQLCADAPLFMVLGNHDGEKGTSGTDPEDIGPWSYRMRTERFPPPIAGTGGYTGRTDFKDGRGAEYYAFEWGDALIVVLDPFSFTTQRGRGGGGGGGGGRREEGPLPPDDSSWNFTLGKAQYDWLAETLAKSKARFKFIFTHHLVGGVGGTEARGGVESARFFEWGGKNADGSDGFAKRRAGWAMPIHDLLVKHGVTAVFHGHDHLYVHSEKDGVTYQCVPQPGNALGGTRSAESYGYASGTLLGSPGHMRVKVSPDKATVDFIRASLGADEGRRAERETNGAVIASYDLKPRD